MQTTNPEYLSTLFQAVVLPSTPVELPKSRQVVDVLTLLRSERRWHGPTPASFNSVPNKPVLDFNDQPTWAEFILLRTLEGDGWKGAWIKNWRGREFWRNPLETAELPSLANAIFQSLESQTAHGGGCWDILVQREEEVLFIESKQRGNDSISSNQAAWLESALQYSVPLSSFLIVEWSRDKGLK
jgi:hypothetical protein